MVLTLYDGRMRAVREIEECTLDVAFGSDENRIKVACDPSLAPKEGWYAVVEGTEYGGTIDEVAADSDGLSVTCKGRTWHGMLAGKRLLPDGGEAYLSVRGGVGEVLASLLARMGLDGLFEAAEDQREVSYTFDRFIDGYSGLRAMLKASGLKLSMRFAGGRVLVSAPPVVDYASKVDSDLLDFTITSVHRCVNHLVCAGSGELEEREVIHFYADAAGNVSHEQSLFGVDEICALYDYSNAEDLEEEGRKKLLEYQTSGSVEVDAHDDIDVDVGDVVSAHDNVGGRIVSAEVVKKILKLKRGVPSFSYEVGSATTTKTSSTASGGGSGGHAYYAGKGLSLENYTFSAEVDSEALAAVEAKADAAAKAVGDLAADSVAEVAAAYPVTATKDERRVTVGVACVTQSDANDWFS